jgi:hypothetical protein
MKRITVILSIAGCLVSGCSYTLEKVTPAGTIPPALGLQQSDNQGRTPGTETHGNVLTGAVNR